MNRDKIKLIANVPLIFTMEGGEQGKETTSNFHDGKEYRYFVTHRGAPSILYLPYDGAKAVSLTNAQTDDEVEIVKQSIGREITYQARLVQSRLPAYETPQAAQPTRLLAPIPQYAYARPTAPPPPPAPPAPPVMNEPVYQHGAAAPQQSEPIRQTHPLEELMTRCFVVSGRALWNARQTLIAEGVPMPEFTPEDYRAAGISMWIERSRSSNGGRS